MCNSVELCAQPAAKGSKLRWKTSEKGNSYLSFYGLKVTVFPDTRGDGWTVCVSRNGGEPTYSNHATQAEARVSGKQAFLRLKRSGEFKPPRVSSAAWTGEVLQDIAKAGHVPPELGAQFTELSAFRKRKAERADLFELATGGGRAGLYWVPHSQSAVISDDADYCRLVVTTWWLDRAEAVG